MPICRTTPTGGGGGVCHYPADYINQLYQNNEDIGRQGMKLVGDEEEGSSFVMDACTKETPTSVSC